ncbi:hypothetical protein BDA99DRAFT_536033 [Phascolomyces articulosus]|uniref:Uncharacterized protein n=1 Tax=Phascolomyces articulosus TaxID=60185 RepID=A0AAD5KC16_9FUNG|nr:hypothetical protein BDA99DRAFT_536033 [Phascolomyces articulosus]
MTRSGIKIDQTKSSAMLRIIYFPYYYLIKYNLRMNVSGIYTNQCSLPKGSVDIRVDRQRSNTLLVTKSSLQDNLCFLQIRVFELSVKNLFHLLGRLIDKANTQMPHRLSGSRLTLVWLLSMVFGLVKLLRTIQTKKSLKIKGS